MQSPYDVMAKGLVEGALTGPCVVRVEQEVVADARTIDAVIEPDPARLAELASRGLIGRMAEVYCSIEAHHDPPTADDLEESVLKVIALHIRKKTEWKALPVASRGPCPQRPVLWIVSAGVPKEVLKVWPMEPITGWPDGCFWARSERSPKIIVASMLPRTRATLLLRLMGADKTLRDAYEDLHALPTDAWERRVASPLLELLRHDLPRMGIPVYTAKEDEMRYIEALKIAEERELWSLQQGRDQGLSLGLSLGLAPLLRLYARKLGRELSDAERAKLVTRLDSDGADRVGDAVLDLDPVALAAWIASPDAQ